MKDLGNGLWLNDDGMLRGNHLSKRRNKTHKLSYGAQQLVDRMRKNQIADAIKNRAEIKSAFEFLGTLGDEGDTR